MTLSLSRLAARGPGLRLCTAERDVNVDDCFGGAWLETGVEHLRGRSVLIATHSQLAAAIALLELDGVAQRIVLCPPDLDGTQLTKTIAAADAQAVVCDAGKARPEFRSVPICTVLHERKSCGPDLDRTTETEWVLLTSGTTGVPKLVVHTLATLAGAIARGISSGARQVWGTLYDIRRYGGLQILLRAIAGGGALVLPDGEERDEFLRRAGALGISYLSGTPSHWRRTLMSSGCDAIAPRCIRLSGEIADQPILDALKTRYPDSSVVHAFASTEAGVGFEVADGREGFPAALLDQPGAAVEMTIEDGTLRLRSQRAALRILGTETPIRDSQGFVDTGDLIERCGARCHFAGRRDGTINIGGNKVHPEEVEAAINRHPRVRMSCARARKNPVLGALIEADVVLCDGGAGEPGSAVEDILAWCGGTLPPHKRPIRIHVVPSLAIGSAGKLERRCD